MPKTISQGKNTLDKCVASAKKIAKKHGVTIKWKAIDNAAIVKAGGPKFKGTLNVISDVKPFLGGSFGFQYVGDESTTIDLGTGTVNGAKEEAVIISLKKDGLLAS